MRILSISTDRKIFNQNSAVAQRMIEYAQTLGELHIIVFSLYHPDIEPRKIAPNVWLYPTSSQDKFHYISDAVRIGKYVLSTLYFGPSIITTQDPFETGIVGVILKKVTKLPLQIQLHTDAWDNHFRYLNLLNWLRVSVLARLTLRFADQVRTVSEKSRRDVIAQTKVAPEKAQVLPVFVDVMRYANAQTTKDVHRVYPQWRIIILMASRLTKEKDIPLAIKAFKRLSSRYEDIGLVIVGSGPEKEALMRMVEKSKLEGRVAFEDWQIDLVDYFRTADIFLNTSLYEGYGMTLMEAGASGRPLVTTRVGVGYSFLEDGRNALVCPVGDEDCIYNKLVNLMENPSIARALGVELQKNVLAEAMTREGYVAEWRKLFDALH